MAKGGAGGGCLTDKQRRFVEEYLVDLNATAAYRRAGYQAKTDNAAAAGASEILRNPKVAQAVAEAQAARSAATGITAERVLKELACVAFSDPADVLDFSGTEARLRPACEIPEAARRAIASIKVRRALEGGVGKGGPEARTVEITEYKLWDKNAALEKLAKHLGVYVERHELTGAGGKPIEAKVTHGIAPELLPHAAAVDAFIRGALERAGAAGEAGEVRPDGRRQPVDAAPPHGEAGPVPAAR